MLKAAIEKILSLDAPHIEEIEGRTYVDKDMTQIGKELRATSITMSNLSSLVDFIKRVKQISRLVITSPRWYLLLRFVCSPVWMQTAREKHWQLSKQRSRSFHSVSSSETKSLLSVCSPSS